MPLSLLRFFLGAISLVRVGVQVEFLSSTKSGGVVSFSRQIISISHMFLSSPRYR